ncbi:MAG: carboxypeptidase-like regulatory domain-containing protein [Thermodesulfobacteriota bacterium]|nr:carboxypeptidase-like regulatory domain-containing protein [Thermodesulfobacteriota bacterium]
MNTKRKLLVSITYLLLTIFYAKVALAFSISGKVVDESNIPLANIWVNAYSESTGFSGGTRTLSDGTYNFVLEAASDYLVVAWSDDYIRKFYPDTQYYNEAELLDLTGDNITNINFILKTGNKIEGILTDVSGSPLSGIHVHCFSEKEKVEGFCKSKSDGTYIINTASASDYRVIAWSDDYVMKFYDDALDYMDATLVDNTGGNVTGINFSLFSGNTISGKVTDKNGTPLAEINIDAFSEKLKAGGHGFTDEDGNYAINLSPSDDYIVVVRVREYIKVFYDNSTNWERATKVDISEEDAAGINFTLNKGNIIAGKVEGQGQKPLAFAGIFVHSKTKGFASGTFTFEDGTYSINVPPAGDYRVVAHADGYVEEFYDGVHSPEEASLVDTESGDQLNINFSLEKGHSISGKVTDTAGNPLTDIDVGAFSESSKSGGGILTDSNGNYKINLLPASDYIVRTFSENYITFFYNNTTKWNEAELIDLTQGDTTGINFTLSKGNNISGKVTDKNGTAIKNIDVGAFSESTGSHAHSRTKNDGTYSLMTTPAKDYVVEVFSKDYVNIFYNQTTVWDKAEKIDTTSGDISGIDFILTGGNKISGTVTDIDNNPLSGIDIHAFSDSTNNHAHNITESDGKYILTVIPAGDYVIAAESYDYLRQYYNNVYKFDDAEKIDVSQGSRENINFVLMKGSVISGMITDIDEVPLKNIGVNAFSESTGTGHFTLSKEDGNYKLMVYPASDYIVNTHSDNYITLFYNQVMDYMKATKIDVTGGDSTGINFKLSKGHKISGTVTDTSQNPVFADVFAFRKSNPQMSQGTCTDESGIYSLMVVPAPDYIAGARAEGYQDNFYPGVINPDNAEILDITSQDKENINFTLIPLEVPPITGSMPSSVKKKSPVITSSGTGIILGGVYDSSTGEGLDRVRVSSNSGGAAISIGGLYFMEVPAGICTVSAYLNGYNSSSKSEVTVNSGETTSVDFILETTSETGSISGTITDSGTGAGISGVTVKSESGEYSTTTDTSGNYTLNNIKEGLYKLTVSKSNYLSTYKSNIKVSALEETTANFSLTANLDVGSIKGRVLDSESQSGISDAVISTGNGLYSAESDDEGDYLLDGIPEGTYTIKVSATSYASKTVENISVGSDEITALDITLTYKNYSPYEPKNPYPSDGAKEQRINLTLRWIGGDPNPGDTVKYDLYFGTEENPSIYATSLNTERYAIPEKLLYSTIYYWKIVSRDQLGEETEGSVWSFTTKEEKLNCPAEEVFGKNSPEVELLRNLRDKLLTQTKEGRKIIDGYYKNGDEITKILRENQGIEKLIQDTFLGNMNIFYDIVYSNKGVEKISEIPGIHEILIRMEEFAGSELKAYLEFIKNRVVH